MFNLQTMSDDSICDMIGQLQEEVKRRRDARVLPFMLAKLKRTGQGINGDKLGILDSDERCLTYSKSKGYAIWVHSYGHKVRCKVADIPVSKFEEGCTYIYIPSDQTIQESDYQDVYKCVKINDDGVWGVGFCDNESGITDANVGYMNTKYPSGQYYKVMEA